MRVLVGFCPVLYLLDCAVQLGKVRCDSGINQIQTMPESSSPVVLILPTICPFLVEMTYSDFQDCYRSADYSCNSRHNSGHQCKLHL